MTLRPAALAAGLGLATACLAMAFRGPRRRFWDRFTLAGLGLGAYALAVEPAARRLRPRLRDVTLGLASAAALYVIFRLGDPLARHIVPGGSSDIEDLYRLRTLRPPGELAVRLAAVIGPAEELFWRGFVQARLMRSLGRWPGTLAATACYGGAHLVTGNLALAGAAGVAGAHWGLLYAAGVPLPALIVSHSVWDLWIFLVQPIGATGTPALGY